MRGVRSAGLALVCLLASSIACVASPGLTSEPPAATSTPAVTAAESPAPPPSITPSLAAPPNTPTPEPTPAVLIAAGDVAGCESQGDEATGSLVEGLAGTVAVLGDTAYPSGTAQEFAECYDPSWGRFRDRTRPAVGNHEYATAGASGYFAYFGDAAGPAGLGYYSYDLGAWHIIVLNSQCWEIGGCSGGDPQAQWLQADLAAHPVECSLAYWHVPRFSSGIHGSSDVMQAAWDLLAQAGAEIVLSGHDHDYERFAPQNASGGPDPERGIREFVVGTGGYGTYFFPTDPLPNSEVRDASTYGVLLLRLYEGRYEWEFLPVEGGTFSDSGSGSCH